MVLKLMFHFRQRKQAFFAGKLRKIKNLTFFYLKSFDFCQKYNLNVKSNRKILY